MRESVAAEEKIGTLLVEFISRPPLGVKDKAIGCVWINLFHFTRLDKLLRSTGIC